MSNVLRLSMIFILLLKIEEMNDIDDMRYINLSKYMNRYFNENITVLCCYISFSLISTSSSCVTVISINC